MCRQHVLRYPETGFLLLSRASRSRRWRRQHKLAALGYANYKAYLGSPHWRRLRRAYAESDEPQDCICGTTERLQLHHLTYERLGAERMSDLTWLCFDCHRMIHDLERRGEIGLDFAGFINARRAERNAEEADARAQRIRVDMRDSEQAQRAIDGNALVWQNRLLRKSRQCIKHGINPVPALEKLLAECEAELQAAMIARLKELRGQT